MHTASHVFVECRYSAYFEEILCGHMYLRSTATVFYRGFVRKFRMSQIAIIIGNMNFKSIGIGGTVTYFQIDPYLSSYVLVKVSDPGWAIFSRHPKLGAPNFDQL